MHGENGQFTKNLIECTDQMFFLMSKLKKDHNAKARFETKYSNSLLTFLCI